MNNILAYPTGSRQSVPEKSLQNFRLLFVVMNKHTTCAKLVVAPLNPSWSVTLKMKGFARKFACGSFLVMSVSLENFDGEGFYELYTNFDFNSRKLHKLRWEMPLETSYETCAHVKHVLQQKLFKYSENPKNVLNSLPRKLYKNGTMWQVFRNESLADILSQFSRV